MSTADQHGGSDLQQPPVPGFALTYVGSLAQPAAASRRSRFRSLARAAALGITIQLAIGALIAVVAVVFIEDLHSDDHGRSSTDPPVGLELNRTHQTFS